MQFNQPRTTGDGINLKDYVGRLILAYPKEIREGVSTSFGPKDPLLADIVILDGPEAGKEYTDTLIFQGFLIGQLKGYIGDPNPALGRIGYGQGKPGQQPPYMLADFTDADAATATAYLQRNPRGINRPAAAAPAQEQINYSTGEISTPAPQPAATAPAPQAGGVDVGQIKALLGLGLADHDIATATGATMEQVQAIKNLPF